MHIPALRLCIFVFIGIPLVPMPLPEKRYSVVFSAPSEAPIVAVSKEVIVPTPSCQSPNTRLL